MKYWHIMNRVRPFSYERPTETKAKLVLLGMVLSVLLFISYI